MQEQATKTASSMHWAQMGESTFIAGMWLLYHIHRVLGRWPFLACLYPVVIYYWATRKVARQASLQYLRRLHASRSVFAHEPGARENLHHFLTFAQVILDKTLAMTGRYRTERVRFEGREALIERIQSGQGAVVATAHMGCIELCQCIAQQRPGLKLNILVHTQHAQRFNRLMQRLAPDCSVQLLQVSEFDAGMAMLLAQKVAQGEFIAIAADRVPVHDSKTVAAQFLGYPAQFPCGPYVIAALLKCPLYFMGCVHEGDGYAVQFIPIAQQIMLPRNNRQQALAVYAQTLALHMEQMLEKAPYDWFNFFPFWDQAKGAPAARQVRS